MDGKIISFKEMADVLRGLDIPRDRPVIAHASLSAFGAVHGGTQTILGALLAAFDAVMMPAFTYKTMLTPEAGPPGNGLDYGRQHDLNRMAEFFDPQMPADRLMGAVAETLRRHPLAWRSTHPILSFTGIGVEAALETQTLAEPLAPIGWLVDAGGWVLLLGVDHTVNTSIHYAEALAGRRRFIRWAMTPSGVVECPGFPGCSLGFEALAPDLEGVTRKAFVGPASIRAVPLQVLVEGVRIRLAGDPLGLLCRSPDCLRCKAIRGESI